MACSDRVLWPAQVYSSRASFPQQVGFADCTQVDMLGLWYESFNFGAGKSQTIDPDDTRVPDRVVLGLATRGDRHGSNGKTSAWRQNITHSGAVSDVGKVKARGACTPDQPSSKAPRKSQGGESTTNLAG